MREIVLDTETTGLDPGSGDRVVEIGCIELLNHIPTGQVWHNYFNPERECSTGQPITQALARLLIRAARPRGADSRAEPPAAGPES